MHGWIWNPSIKAFDGRNVNSQGVSNISLRGRLLRTEIIVVNHLVPGIETIIGMDVICYIGGSLLMDVVP